MESVKRISIALFVGALIFAATGHSYKYYGHGVALLVNMVSLGAVTAYLAHRKNRSKVGWFLLGTFTGVLGLGFALGVRPLDKDKTSELGLKSGNDVKSAVGEE